MPLKIKNRPAAASQPTTSTPGKSEAKSSSSATTTAPTTPQPASPSPTDAATALPITPIETTTAELPVWTEEMWDKVIAEAEEVHQPHVDTLGGSWHHCIAATCCAVRKVLEPLVPEVRSRNDRQSNDSIA